MVDLRTSPTNLAVMYSVATKRASAVAKVGLEKSSNKGVIGRKGASRLGGKGSKGKGEESIL